MRVWLRKLREDAMLTHAQVANIANISRSYYTNIERNAKTPTVEVAKSIGDVLNFPWEYFFKD